MIIVDTETSGVIPHLHSILSVAALELENPDNRFVMECSVWEGAHINDDSLEFTGFTKEEVTDPHKPNEGALVMKFLEWTETIPGDRTLAAQNVSFDRDFLQAAAGRAHLNWPLAYRTFDVHTICYMHLHHRGLPFPIENHRSTMDLDAILNYVGIPDEPIPHTALTGCISHAEVISRMLYDKKLLPEFAQFPIPWIHA